MGQLFKDSLHFFLEIIVETTGQWRLTTFFKTEPRPVIYLRICDSRYTFFHVHSSVLSVVYYQFDSKFKLLFTTSLYYYSL